MGKFRFSRFPAKKCFITSTTVDESFIFLLPQDLDDDEDVRDESGADDHGRDGDVKVRVMSQKRSGRQR